MGRYLNGITVLRAEDFKVVKEFDKIIDNNYLFCFEPLNLDNLFVGTSAKGLIHYANGKSQITLEGNTNYSLLNTKDGLIIGTKDSGMFILENESVKSINGNLSARGFIRLNDRTLVFEKNGCILQEKILIYRLI